MSKNIKLLPILLLIILPALILGGCGAKKVEFSTDTTNPDDLKLTDNDSKAPISFTQSYSLNQEFKVSYQTTDPGGTGTVTFKARSLKEIPTAGKKTPDDGKKLILAEITVKGGSKNLGQPSTFNQIGQHPSPQFVLVDTASNQSIVEETYYSDGFTEANKLFELSKITLDSDQWVNTAIVFQTNQSQDPHLALRFTNPSGKVEFYDIKK